MNRINFLLIESNKEKLEMVMDVLNLHPGWNKTIAENTEDAIEKIHQQDFDFLLIDKGINQEEEKKLVKLMNLQQPEVLIIKYNGLENELLVTEIQQALEKQKETSKAVYYINDDVFKLQEII